jgi:hypothetical protein
VPWLFLLGRTTLGGTDTCAAVLDNFASWCELANVVADHFFGDCDILEGLAVVHANSLTDHDGQDDHIAAVRFDTAFLGELLEEELFLLGEATLDLSANVTREEVRKLSHTKLFELVH